ncbi:MAG: fused MFS/spermidine synthase [Betaproteobacteria bacterium]
MTLFASTIALSAFLLFLVQPIIAKQILPWFGGSAAVWTTCMVFFQFTLLAGYFYADTMVRKVAPRRQAVVHTSLLLLSLAVLPIVPSEALKPVDGSDPTLRILGLLALTIGLPYLMLSTTGPLVQAWFARRYAGERVYRLYALSNVASMSALVAYPPLIEPLTSARVQSWGWSAAYAAFALLAVLSAWAGARAAPRASTGALDTEAAFPPHEEGAADASNAASTTEAAPTWALQGLWLLLSALGSVMLLACTTHITQNVASIPFLWVLPLSLYLLTFILCFDGQGWYRSAWMRPAAAVLCTAMLGALTWRLKWPEGWPWIGMEEALMPITQAVPLYALGLFAVCMFCHGELVARKPAPAHLTRFYLMVSLGGAVGGLLVGLVAPVVFDWTWELPLALALAGLLVLGLSSGWTARGFAVLCLGASVWSGVKYHDDIRSSTIEISRNFYGTLRVQATAADGQPNAAWRLMHGVIIHGEQYRDEARRRQATTYYGPTSGIGRTITTLRDAAPGQPQRVGLIGLGVGTLATYGRAGDHYRIYELNPAVLDLARRRFSYLADSAAEIVTPLGDARLVLEREAPQGLDVLAVDAFSSDSIPVHLITREAMAAYRRHVHDGGAIVFHISNRYLELTGVVRQLADSIGWTALRVVDEPPKESDDYHSDWIVVTRNPALIQGLREQTSAKEAAADPRLKPWTDGYNNLFQVLK